MRREVGDRELGYDDRGRGPAVVLLHPFPCARDVWRTVVEPLAFRYRVITVDARGFGESPLRATGGASAPYAIADLADDVAALLDALDVGRAALLGQSMGGYTALAFAAKHAARLTALVLADTRAAADSPETRAAREKALATIHGPGVDAYLDTSLGRLVSPGATPTVRALVRSHAETRADSLVAGIEALRDRPDRTAELGAIACPTLCLCGAEDLVTPPEEMRRLAAAIPAGRYVELAGAGHLSHLEAEGAFVSAVVSFLGAALPARGAA
jgi:pimeloyl-ACP methyl ester carboxylesterase